MGITKTEVYIVVCDVCGEILGNDEGDTLCSFTKEDADEYRSSHKWLKKDNKLACPNCYEDI